MAAPLVLMAEPRTALGKKNGALRQRQARFPASFTARVRFDHPGPGRSPRVREVLRGALGLNKPFTLKWDGGSARVVIRDVQMNHLGTTPVHVDFYDGHRRRSNRSPSRLRRSAPRSITSTGPICLYIRSVSQRRVDSRGPARPVASWSAEPVPARCPAA